jgi:hypothetical protein
MEMKEFGSDYHQVEGYKNGKNMLVDFYPDANFYADGRQALIHLYKSQGWKRLWLPEYFCYDVVDSLKEEGLNIRFYADWPGYKEDDKTLDTILRNGFFRPTDAVLRVNYYGMRAYRNTKELPIAAMIEDHTHDLIGGWARRSNADWCVASLRKTLPIAEGGMLWSPVGFKLPKAPVASVENERIASVRWEAMEQKARYLAGEDLEKEIFRACFVDTERFFNTVPICAMDERSRQYLRAFDICGWYRTKKENWEILQDINNNGIKVFMPEDRDCYPFSLILLFDEIEKRNYVKKLLIEKYIYPTVLWSVPLSDNREIFEFSRKMLSIHCDARYTKENIMKMKSIIESVLLS